MPIAMKNFKEDERWGSYSYSSQLRRTEEWLYSLQLTVYRHFYPTALSRNPLKGNFVLTLDLRCSYSRFFLILWLAYFDYLIIISYATLRLLRLLQATLVELSSRSDPSEVTYLAIRRNGVWSSCLMIIVEMTVISCQSQMWFNLFIFCIIEQTKGTTSFGKRHTKTHTACRRCGKISFHKQKKECSSCGYPEAKTRSCKLLIWFYMYFCILHPFSRMTCLQDGHIHHDDDWQ